MIRRKDARFAELTAGINREVPVRCATVRGDPNATIVEYALDNKADLMVVGLRGSGGINKVRASLLGSVAQAMIRKSPCPVLVVRPDNSRQFDALPDGQAANCANCANENG
jgi:nucleotide-binding universal stress UspA family protein